ncbi:MAG: hypothetical protein JWO86_8470, partial [Myxococcaceae bacterium]|nr:hypothetical protein [Myxococcaceae bacterium]
GRGLRRRRPRRRRRQIVRLREAVHRGRVLPAIARGLVFPTPRRHRWRGGRRHSRRTRRRRNVRSDGRRARRLYSRGRRRSSSRRRSARSARRIRCGRRRNGRGSHGAGRTRRRCRSRRRRWGSHAACITGLAHVSRFSHSGAACQWSRPESATAEFRSIFSRSKVVLDDGARVASWSRTMRTNHAPTSRRHPTRCLTSQSARELFTLVAVKT